MDKWLLLDAIVGEITSALDNSLAAAEEARATATNKENAAENKYDTLGLEAAYLAHGQSERVLQLEGDLAAYLDVVAVVIVQTAPRGAVLIHGCLD